MEFNEMCCTLPNATLSLYRLPRLAKLDADSSGVPCNDHSVERYTFAINGRFNEGKGPPVAFRRVHERSIT
eukprot:scaffold168279_cov37-Prasinocladus_malaysianus.AAC.1